MIKITSLCKVYRSKKRKKCYALNDVNLTLPDAGLVFVLGKSGSGKSTLLNLIGGLDKITSGTIEVDGNDISHISERRMCNYRNSHVGFIFQDYHLIEEMTVYDNIVFSLDLRRRKDKGDVCTALEKVGLAGYENRYPSELSGGERQRVAIARAIIKDPRIILADEPTGNLDTQTATSIIELLKELSCDRLILVVSHNRRDAYAYADRIIELSNGNIVGDYTRRFDMPEGVEKSAGVLLYPEGKELSDEDITLINANARKRIVKLSGQYTRTLESKQQPTFVEIIKENLNFFKKIRLSFQFLRRKTVAIALSSFMVAVIMVIMSLAQTIVHFDASNVIAEEGKKANATAVMMLKQISQEQKVAIGSNAEDYFVEISNHEIEQIRNVGYEGDIYSIYNFFMPIQDSSSEFSAGWSSSFLGANSVYVRALLGTLVVDEAFLEEKFGEVSYLAKLDEFHPGGIIITDYVADAIRAHNVAYLNKPYEELLGNYTWGAMYGYRGYINGIIYTGYKERYQSLCESVAMGDKTFSEIANDPSMIDFTNEIYSSLGFGYSLNPEFATAFGEHNPCEIIWHQKLNFEGFEYTTAYRPQIRCDKWLGIELADDEILVSYLKYNDIFGTDYNEKNYENFSPVQITLSHYRYYDIQNEAPLWSKQVTVKGFWAMESNTDRNATIVVSENAYREFAQQSLFAVGVYLNGSGKISAAIDAAEDMGYTQYNSILEGIHTMTRAVDVFVPIFKLIAIVLCVGVIFILVNFSSRMIKDKMHEIGILKALGTQNGTIATVFGLQVVLIAFFTCVLATLGYYYFIDFANDVLIESLQRLASSSVVLDLNFLTFQKDIARDNCILVFVLTIIALIAPMVKVKVIKPVKIIKTKD